MIRNNRILSAICALLICVFITTFGLSSCTKRSKSDPHDVHDAQPVSSMELPSENTGSEDVKSGDTPTPAEDTEHETEPNPSAAGATATQVIPGPGLPEIVISMNTGNRNPDSAEDATSQNTILPVNTPSSTAAPSPSPAISTVPDPDNSGANDILTAPQPIDNSPSTAVPSPPPMNSTVLNPDNSGDILLPELP